MRISVALVLSLISNPNWISCSSQVEAGLLDELALGAIISFLGFIGLMRFGFNSRGIGLVLPSL